MGMMEAEEAMRLRIHRGAKEIGGNCIELECNGKHLLLDLGLPLNCDPESVELPDVPWLRSGPSDEFLGVVLSHPHQDHYGLASRIHPDTPFFLGEDARKILEVASRFTPSGLAVKNATYLKNQQPLKIGPFRVTPYLVDHSAFDAYSLLVEAEGETLFYTGDFRGHGRKRWSFEKLLSDGPKDVDVLLMEGTTVGPNSHERVTITESELETQIVTSLRDTRGLALACFSGQNIDRLVTFYRAAIRTNRTLVIDPYIASILEVINRSSLPNARSNNVKVYLPRRMKMKVVRVRSFDLVEPFRNERIYTKELAANPERYVMAFRDSMLSDIDSLNSFDGMKLMYSLWPGYLDQSRSKLRAWCEVNGIGLEVHHTSGHAPPEDLKRLVEAIRPKRLVPIHTMHPEDFLRLSSVTEVYEEKSWLKASR